MTGAALQAAAKSLSRRDLLKACTFGLPCLTEGLCRMLNAETSGTGRAIMNGPVNIPPDFAGMHFHKWPQGNPPSPAPTYGYGTVRSHDYGVAWNVIHTAPGRYAWDKLDGWVHAHAGARKTLIYTLYGTPAWISSKSAVRDAYGQSGAGASPRSLQILAEFITALISRYNTHAQQLIRYLELWNEPHFLQNDRGFWWGSADELAELCRCAATAARAVDPQVRVLSPGFDGLQAGPLQSNAHGVEASLRDFLQARDGAGRNPGYLLDGVAIHTYNAHLDDATGGLEGIVLHVKQMLEQARVKVPIFTTESGYMHDPSFDGVSLDGKARQLRRQAAVQAALGVQCVCFYAHDDEYCGNPSRNGVIAAAINEIHTKLAGQRLEQVTVQKSGEVSVQASSGSFVW